MNQTTPDAPSPLPQTLRQLGGAPATSPPLSDCAIVVIDAQREYLDGGLVLPDVRPALDNIETLLASARSLGRPVIHVAHQGDSGGLFDPASGGRIIEQVGPAAGEIVVPKTEPNSFNDTILRATLKELGDPHLILCGFMTHMCVSSTARAASDLGLSTTVVVDASATRPLPNPDGTNAVSHRSLHEAALAALSDGFSILATTNELV